MTTQTNEKLNTLNLYFDETGKVYRRLMESVPYGLFITDDDGVLYFVNTGFCNILRFPGRDRAVGRNLLRELFAEPDAGQAFCDELSANGYVREIPVTCRSQDGLILHLVLSAKLILNDRSQPIGWEGVIRDATEDVRQMADLKAEKAKLEELLTFDDISQTIHNVNKLVDIIVERTVSLLDAERCSLMLYDESKEELSIRGAHGLSDDVILQTRIKLGESIVGKVAKERRSLLVQNIEYDKTFGRSNRTTYKRRSFMSVPIELNDRLLGVINVAERKSPEQEAFTPLDLKILRSLARQAAVAIENAELYQQLEHLSLTDPLTGLHNYRYFIKIVDEEIQRFRRNPEPFCIIMMDTDHFKEYNDDFGHLEGDKLLKTLGDIFHSSLRVTDRVCRYGGDEFIILLPGTNLEQAHQVAEKVRQSVAAYEFLRPVTVSVGICEYKKTLTRIEFIFKADRALYQAKRAGRNRVAC